MEQTTAGRDPARVSGPADDHDDALLREAAHRLADTVAPYRVLTRESLAALSGVDDWRTVGFDQALGWAVDHGVLRRLDADLYEISARSSTSSSPDPEATPDGGTPVDW